MEKKKTIQTEIGGYISTLLRSRFGKGPSSVYVTINRPFITIHFRGFMTPMEKILVKQNEVKRVLETRDLLMNDLRPEIRQELKRIGNFEVTEIYADWNLVKETGLMIGIIDEEVDKEALKWPDDAAEQKFQEQINEASNKAEKIPARTETYWLSDRTILVKRSGILVQIEKELIKNGYVEALKLSKRPLEHRVLQSVALENVLNRKISETFLDWNFEKDLSYIVFLLEPKK